MVEGKFRREPQFRELLESELPDELLVRAIAALSDAGDRYAGKLVEFVLLKGSASRLAEKLGPKQSNPLEWLPFYLQVAVARKLVTGERVTDEEWIEVLVDAGASAVPFGKGGSILRQSLKKTAERAAEKLGTTAAKAAARSIAGDAGREAAKREIGRWGATGMMVEFQRLSKTLAEHAAVDITPMVRMMYERGGLGRKLFRRGTELEARVFMRGDARVLVQFDRLAYWKAREYLEQTARETVKDTVAGEREALARRNTAAVLLLENRIGADAQPPR